MRSATNGRAGSRIALASIAAALVGACSGGPARADATLDAVLDAATATDAPADLAPVDTGVDVAPPGDAGPVELQRVIESTSLRIDVGAHTGHAEIALAASTVPNATFEAGGLTVSAVRDHASGNPLTFAMQGALLLVTMPSSAATIEVDYTYLEHNPADFRGANANYTLLWPYWCGNVYPCHSDPAQGSRFTLAITGVATGLTAVYPTAIVANAPAYQLAWAVDDYASLDLGTTTAGTHLTVHYLRADEAAARAGTAHLVAAFEWYEQTLGAYVFGSEAGSVEVGWGPGAFGGMEHHPLWHIGQAAIGDELTHMHEAAHGWFGDGVRIACWEDFVLSEGTVNYLASRAMGATEGATAEAAVWQRYNTVSGGLGLPAWPDSCHQVDVLADHLFSQAPYVRGANFYRALENRIGRPMLDAILRRFFAEHHGGAARLSDMIALVQTVAGYDATACASAWLRPARAGVRGPDACP